MPTCHHLPTNQVNWITVMPIWKNVVPLPSICPLQCHQIFLSLDEYFGTYLAKKRAEGNHYNVALSHATKKLVRTVYAMETPEHAYVNTT